MKFKQYLLLEMSLAKAASFAADKHQGQFRKTSGSPYITHPRGVYTILKDLRVKDIEIMVSAYLHDTIEDTPTSYNEIKREFSKNVADTVRDLTSDNKEIKRIGKPEYLLQKMLKMPDNSLTIKLADRVQNLSDLATSNTSFADKMWEQTWYIVSGLRQSRNLNTIHKKLLRKIEKQLISYKEQRHEI